MRAEHVAERLDDPVTEGAAEAGAGVHLGKEGHPAPACDGPDAGEAREEVQLRVREGRLGPREPQGELCLRGQNPGRVRRGPRILALRENAHSIDPPLGQVGWQWRQQRGEPGQLGEHGLGFVVLVEQSEFALDGHGLVRGAGQPRLVEGAPPEQSPAVAHRLDRLQRRKSLAVSGSGCSPSSGVVSRSG